MPVVAALLLPVVMFSNLNPRRTQANAEAARRRAREVTYTRPLGLEAGESDADMEALRAFLKEFYPTFYDRSSRAKRQHVAHQHPEVAAFQEALVPGSVSEEEFWQRYYFRCDPKQILLEWERHPERGRRAMGEAVTNWFDERMGSMRKVVLSGDNGIVVTDLDKRTKEKKIRRDEDETVSTAASSTSSILDGKNGPGVNSGPSKKAGISEEKNTSKVLAEENLTKKATNANINGNDVRAADVASSACAILPGEKKWLGIKLGPAKKSDVLREWKGNEATLSKKAGGEMNGENNSPVKENGGKAVASSKEVAKNKASGNNVQSADTGPSSLPNQNKIKAYVPPHKRVGNKAEVTSPTANRWEKLNWRRDRGNTGCSQGHKSNKSKTDVSEEGQNDEVPKAPQHEGKTGVSEKKITAPSADLSITNSTVKNRLVFPNMFNMTKSRATGLLLLLLCCASLAFLLFLSRRGKICASFAFADDAESHWGVSLCSRPPVEAIDVLPAPEENNKRAVVGRKRLWKGRKKQPQKNERGNPGREDTHGSGADNNGLVESLISSWMQNTDMAQMMGGMEGDNGGPALPSGRGPQAQSGAGGVARFFQRPFGGDDASEDLAPAVVGGYDPGMIVPNQPQMVIHQHVHHVVHHVVHEYKE